MAATLESLAARLGRIEDLLSDVVAEVAEPVRTLSVTQVVERTGLPRQMVLAAIRSGDLPAIRVGERTSVVRPDDLDA